MQLTLSSETPVSTVSNEPEVAKTLAETGLKSAEISTLALKLEVGPEADNFSLTMPDFKTTMISEAATSALHVAYFSQKDR